MMRVLALMAAFAGFPTPVLVDCLANESISDTTYLLCCLDFSPACFACREVMMRDEG